MLSRTQLSLIIVLCMLGIIINYGISDLIMWLLHTDKLDTEIIDLLVAIAVLSLMTVVVYINEYRKMRRKKYIEDLEWQIRKDRVARHIRDSDRAAKVGDIIKPSKPVPYLKNN